MNRIALLFLVVLSQGIAVHAMSKAQKHQAKKERKAQKSAQATAREQAAIAAMKAAPPFKHDVNCPGSCSQCDTLNVRQQSYYSNK